MRDPVKAAVFAVLTSLPWLNKAWHVDEALYLPVARRILEAPLDPYGFLFNWYGTPLPYTAINNTPPLLHYLLAGAWALTGGTEWAMRLLFLPFDFAAAWALYLLAEKYLEKPLLPVLLILSTPVWLLNMGHLMAEKPVMAFGLWAVVLAQRGRWLPSAALLALALVAKYLAVVFLPVVLLALPTNKDRLKALALSCAPLFAYLLWQKAAPGAALLVTKESFLLPTAGWTHRLRSILSFTGGGLLVGAANPWAWGSALLFVPPLDIAPNMVRSLDRFSGIVMACAGTSALWSALSGRKIYAIWTATALLVILAYWSVMARLVLLLAVPVILAFAEKYTVRLAHVAAALALSFGLQWVDSLHAGAYRETVRDFPGKRLWSAGHWGLQEYVERAGGGVLSSWDQPASGEPVIVPRVNSNVLAPPAGAKLASRYVESKVPLRLLSGWTGEGGFYSNVYGFLPFSLSTEPVEEISVVERR
jgi:hypothetical protein